jgi:hypothetical protein
LACGLSQATKSTPWSMTAARKATLRESRSSLAMTSLARSRLHCASAFARSGRAACLPFSTSVELADQLPGAAVEVVAHGAIKLTQELPQ